MFITIGQTFHDITGRLCTNTFRFDDDDSDDDYIDDQEDEDEDEDQDGDMMDVKNLWSKVKQIVGILFFLLLFHK